MRNKRKKPDLRANRAFFQSYKKMKSEQIPEYILELGKIAASLPAGVCSCSVQHDPDCAVFSGGVCRCHPVVEVSDENGRRL